ncbi:unnamed protein product [Alopecurus aequalis]
MTSLINYVYFHVYRMDDGYLLEGKYDKAHRGKLMAEDKLVIGPLRLRCHEASNKNMPYDERYTGYIEKLGLLPWIQLVSRSTMNMNPSAISALIDRWRPETHSFHLRTGEMTVTLQDASMITALPIDGAPVCFITDSKDWCSCMISLIGKAPEPKEDSSSDRLSAGATYKWIREHFAKCPVGANQETIEQYARAYVWYVITRTLFADSDGRNAPWMWLKALSGKKLSWGSGALAYLYRQVIIITHIFS